MVRNSLSAQPQFLTPGPIRALSSGIGLGTPEKRTPRFDVIHQTSSLKGTFVSQQTKPVRPKKYKKTIFAFNLNILISLFAAIQQIFVFAMSVAVDFLYYALAMFLFGIFAGYLDLKAKNISANGIHHVFTHAGELFHAVSFAQRVTVVIATFCAYILVMKWVLGARLGMLLFPSRSMSVQKFKDDDYETLLKS